MGPNTYTAEWSIADDDFDTAMAPATHDIDNGAADVQLDDDSGHLQEVLTSKSFEDTKTDSTRDRQVKVLRSPSCSFSSSLSPAYLDVLLSWAVLSQLWGRYLVIWLLDLAATPTFFRDPEDAATIGFLPNKVYVGGLPDHTRPDDLRNCFGKIGNIVTIELKLGYGFVEFDTREAAEESVARYHEGYFMGNKIRVELSHSRGRTFKRPEDPGACFNCGENGHWARECPRPSTQSRSGPAHDQQSRDRGHTRDYNREGYSNRDDYSKHPSSREGRHYDTSSGPAPPTREHRRAVTPPPRDRREARDYSSRRDSDDYRMRSPPPAQPVSRHDRANNRAAHRDPLSEAPPHRETYDHRRHPHSDDRSMPHAAQSGRPRTPPGPPPGRDDHDKGTR
ncbi:hypothetical protein JVU11DRAFT_5528 [Chiua virens]|nr:hypothetical protein JVU11DRAFT_5528 [Chiua virens]